MASDNVVKLYINNAAKDPNVVLEQAIDNYESVIVVGWNKDGLLDLRASTNISHSDINWILGVTQHKLLNGDYGG